MPAAPQGITLLELFAGSVWMGATENDPNYDDAQLDKDVEQALQRVERMEQAAAPVIRSCLATRPAGATATHALSLPRQ
jgi:hypothetical protein